MFEQSKSFSKLVGLSALLIAGSAAFFSVFGLSKLFAGAQLAVIIMAGSLEFGKLVAASFLYRYWDKINLPHKTYMSIAVVTLVLITSAGIFGFLSNAYQGATVGFEKESTALIYKQDRLDQLLDDKVFLKEELEAAVSELPENYRTAKRKLREEYQPQISQINKDILALKGEVGELKIALVETGVDVGPAIYLAVMFVISYNVTLQDRATLNAATDSVDPKKRKWWEVYGEKKELDFEQSDDSEIVDDAKEQKVTERNPVWVQRHGKTEKLQK